MLMASPRAPDRPGGPQRRPRSLDDRIAIAALVFIAVVLIAALLLSHPAKDSGVGGRVPTVEQSR
jgi:hypothetical protein